MEKTVLTYIIRDHDRDRFERRKKELEHLTRKINNEFPGCASIEINDQYYNMREKVEPVMHIVDLVSEAMRAVDVVPMVKACTWRNRWSAIVVQRIALSQYFRRWVELSRAL